MVKTTDALPEDKGVSRRYMNTYYVGGLEPEEAQAKQAFPQEEEEEPLGSSLNSWIFGDDSKRRSR